MRFLTNHTLEADENNDYLFTGVLPEGDVVFSEIHGGMRRNKLHLTIDGEEATGDGRTRSFELIAEDGQVPNGARFVHAYRPRGVDNAWVIYELISE